MHWGPEQWDRFTLSEPPSAPGREVHLGGVRDFLRSLEGSRRMTVADLGCGRGDLLPFLAAHFRKVVAIDYAPGSLALARRHPTVKPVLYRRRDLRDLTPFRRAFDVAVALDSIVGPRPSDVDRILEQVRRSLVDGGILVATFPALTRSASLQPMALEGVATRPGPLAFSQVELIYRLRRAGFPAPRLQRLEAGPGEADRILCTARARASN